MISRPGRLGLLEDEIPPIPPFEMDREGNRIETTGTTWHLVDEAHHSVTLNWNEIPAGDLKHAFQLWACYLIRSHSTMAVVGIVRSARTVLKFDRGFPHSISELDLNWWKALRQHGREKLRSMSVRWLRNWYLWLTDTDFPGTDEEIALEIEQWSFPHPIKGEAVMARDPDHGPLNARQFAVLTQCVIREQAVSIGQAVTFICKELGPNTRNIALLRASDLHILVDPSDATKRRFQIDIPRIKKRQSRVRQVRRRPLSDSAGTVLERLIAQNRERFGLDNKDLPLFCRKTPLQRPGNRFPWQCTDMDVYRSVVKYGEDQNLMVYGTRVEKFRITPRRLRYTYGTRLAAEGMSVLHISDALDHCNTETAMVYVNASLSMVERLFEHMDPKIAPIMDEFMGRMRKPTGTTTLIAGKTYGGALLGGIGICGSGTLCKLMPGFSCYVCRFYNPVAEAPHREMLEEAYAIRRRYLARDTFGTENSQVEFLDQVIVAIQGAIAASQKWMEMHGRTESGPDFKLRHQDISIDSWPQDPPRETKSND